jgi:hypothetical protein
MIKIRVKHIKFTSEEVCRDMAELLSCIVSGFEAPGVPWKASEVDWTYWTLDQANDYKVTFFPEDPHCFGLTYRYQCEGNQFEEALAAWVAVKLTAEIVEE